MSFWGRLLKRRVWRWVMLALSLPLFFFLYVRDIEPNWIEVRSVSMPLPHLAPAFSGYRIVQLSDIHVDPWMTRHRLHNIVERVNRLKPNLVVLTGDFVTRNPQQFAPNLRALQDLKSSDPPVAVLGNHDAWTDPALIQQTLESVGIQVLNNQVVTLTRADAQLHIGGVDDVWAERDRLEDVLAALPSTGAAILLAHEPDFADESAATGRFDLQLSGHSHGGQVYLPRLLRPLPPLAYRYPAGRYQVGTMIQYTNRGVGISAVRARLNCRPEITVFTLKTA